MTSVRALLISTLTLGVILSSGTAPFCQSNSERPIYLDASQPVSSRVEDLLSRMTLKEKVGQLNLPCVYVDELGKTIPEKMEACKRFAAGTYTNEVGPGCGFFTLADTILHEGVRQQVQYFNELQKIALTQTRLRIPLLEDEEGTHGGMFSGATVFPEGLALGSTFDMPLVKSIYAAAAQESRAVGIHVLSTLVLELDRDPRMGRNEEAYTEDPYLYSRIAANIVEGAQGSDINAPDKVVALMTDFPTQSQPVSGLERGAIDLSERTLREQFLLPWIAAITKYNALGVMAGYPEIDDVPAHASEKWMTEVLRQELGFRGIVMSEGGGFETLIYENIVPTQKEAGALALRAGVDLNITYEPAYMGPLIENVTEGKVPIALVDRAVRRVLELKFLLGLFEHPYADSDQAEKVMHSKEHQDLALRAAREGIVLLKNDNNLLPLKRNLKSIAVIGPNANNASNLFGDYASAVVLQHVETIFDGIKAKASPTTRVSYAKGCGVNTQDESSFPEAVAAAKHADVAVIVVGEQARREGGGEALADVLFGDYNPSARLAITIPRSVGQMPAYYNYQPSKDYWLNRAWSNVHGYVDMPATPLYSFGDGLSYTKFDYSNLRISPSEIFSAGNTEVKVDVKNTGDRPGTETAQLYIHERFAPVSTPVKQLRGFARIELKPGEAETATFILTPEDLQLLDRDNNRWEVVPGTFEIMVGHSSQDIRLKGTLEVRK
jgi:beta-glucosidase